MRFGLVGPSYTARSSSVADEETINFYPESRESGASIAPSRQYGGESAASGMSLLATPGIQLFVTLPQSPTRGSFPVGRRLFAVAGSELYEISSAKTYTALASVSNDGQPASFATNGEQLLIVSGGRAYCLTLATNAVLDVTAQLVGVPVKVEFSDSYFVVHFANSNKYQFSDVLDGTTWPGLYVNEVEVFPEDISSIIVNHRELWVFGKRHAQPYQDTGSAEVFDVIPGAFIETGCVGPFVPCRLDNSVFWVSEDERGARMAWRSNGYTPTRISTYAVEIDLTSYATLEGMTTYSYQDGGHLFWVLYVPGSLWSWVYDVGEGVWHKRATWNAATATWSAHASWNHVYAFGQHLVGDWASGNLYTLTQNALSDNGNVIRRVRRPPTILDEMRWIEHVSLNVDFDMGNLGTINPTDANAYAASLLGPSAGASAVDTSLGGAVWANPGNALLNTGVYASASLVATVSTAPTSTATGTSEGGGAPWSNPANIDSTSAFASVNLTAGGTPVYGPPIGTITNSASASNQTPPPQTITLSGFPSTPATSATLYVIAQGSISASQGGGILTLNYSIDNGATWTKAQSWNAAFGPVTVPISIPTLTNLDTIQVQFVANCSCGPSGYSNVLVGTQTTGNPIWAVASGSGQPTAQTLVGAVSGLAIPAGTTLVGLGLSFNADYTGTAPTFQVGLNVGNLEPSFTLTTTPSVYTAGGSSTLWGVSTWDAATLSSLKVQFFASSTGTTTVNVNSLVVTPYYVQSSLPTDALDLTNFSFVVPAANSPQGITASVLAYASIPGVNLTAQLLKGGVPTGEAQTIPLGTSPTVFRFGGDTNLLGAVIGSSDLEASNFGVRITANTTGGQSATVYVGYTTLQPYCPPTDPSYAAMLPPPALVDGNGNPRPPQAMVRWSDDRGKTWSNEHVLNCGASGNYTTRAILRRLGHSRYRVYEISVTDPVPWVIVDGYLEAK